MKALDFSDMTDSDQGFNSWVVAQTHTQIVSPDGQLSQARDVFIDCSLHMLRVRMRGQDYGNHWWHVCSLVSIRLETDIAQCPFSFSMFFSA